jgi:hypothetical protein
MVLAPRPAYRLFSGKATGLNELLSVLDPGAFPTCETHGEEPETVVASHNDLGIAIRGS